MQLDIRWPSDEPENAPSAYPCWLSAPRLAALQITWDSTKNRRQSLAVAVPLLATPTYIRARTQTRTRTRIHTHIRTRTCTRTRTC